MTKASQQHTRRQLAQAITLAESTRSADRKSILEHLADYDNVGAKTMRIGISGIPGVGKSSFIESFGLHLVRKTKRRLAVLAVDPSSPVRGGSLLGDKTRMQELSREERVFIRPAPAGGYLGGLTRATRESAWLCEMAGYDTVLIETVGVGQSEHEVARLVDVFVLLLQPGAGDTLQGIKRGILELADIVAVNKADGNTQKQAEATAAHYKDALKLAHPQLAEQVFLCSALESQGIDEIWEGIKSIDASQRASGALVTRRNNQNIHWLDEVLRQLLMDRLTDDARLQALRTELERDIHRGKMSVHKAAQSMVQALLSADGRTA